MIMYMVLARLSFSLATRLMKAMNSSHGFVVSHMSSTDHSEMPICSWQLLKIIHISMVKVKVKAGA